MTAHNLERHRNCPNPGRCPICDGGLAHCLTCGGAESCLPTHCPGERMSEDRKAAISAGAIDYKDGQWLAFDAGTGGGAGMA